MINLELNITLQCNLECPNCNRLCHMFPDRTEHMSVSQITKFVEQARSRFGVGNIKVLGGEPLLHPQFVEIYNILTEAASEGVIQNIKIETNGTLPLPKVRKHSRVRWMGRTTPRKRHLPVLQSPKDMGINTKLGCKQITQCGFSLDKYGYLPCSTSIMIVRLLGWTNLYRHELPTEPWALKRLCRVCSFSMDKKWRDHYSGMRLSQHTEDDRKPTITFQKALECWSNGGQEEFYRTQPEF